MPVALFADIVNEPVGFIERKRLAATENPYIAFLSQRRATMYGAQGNALAFRFEGKDVAGFKAQLVADDLRNDDTARFVDGNSRFLRTGCEDFALRCWRVQAARSWMTCSMERSAL